MKTGPHTSACVTTRAWLADTGLGLAGSAPVDSAPHMAHVAGCAACKELLSRYEAFSALCQEACAHEPSAGAEQRFLSAATTADSSAQYSALVNVAARELDHGTTPSVEAAFLEAARAQHAGACVGAAHPSRWKSALSLAVAAGLVLAVGIPILQALWPAAPDAVPTAASVPPPGSAARKKTRWPITIVSHHGAVSVDGELLGAEPSTAGAGAEIVTGPVSRARLRAPSSAATVDSGTRVRIAAWSRQRTALLLRRGTIHLRVGHREAGELFEVRTPNARVTVVGTEFSVTHTARGSTIVRGRSGKVRVERSDGSFAGHVTAGASIRVQGTAAPTHASAPAPAVTPGGRRRAVIPEAPVQVRPPARPEYPPHDVGAPTAPVEPGKPAPPPPEARPSLRQARSLLGRGEDQKALALLLAVAPGDWRRDALLGDAYQLCGKYRLARDAYRTGLTRTVPPPAPLLADLAILLQTRLGNPASAARTWKRYLQHHAAGPAAAQAHLSLARAAMSAGRHKTAERHLRAILKSFPQASQTTAAVTLLGAHLLKQRRWSRAEALFSTHARTGKGQKAEVSLVGLIRVRIGQGRPKAARRLMARYHKRFPKGGRKHEVKRLEDVLAGR